MRWNFPTTPRAPLRSAGRLASFLTAILALSLHPGELAAQTDGQQPLDAGAEAAAEARAPEAGDRPEPPANLQPHEIPLAAFFRTQQARNLRLSPDGKHISMLFPAPEGGDLLALADTASTSIQAIRSPGPVLYADYRWISERYLVFHIGKVFGQGLGIGTVNIETGDNRVLVGQGEAGILDPLPDSTAAFIGYARINNQLGSLVSRIEADTGVRSDFIYGPEGRLMGGFTDARDEVRLVRTWPEGGTAPAWFYRASAYDSWSRLELPSPASTPVGLHADGERIYLINRSESDATDALLAWQPGTDTADAEVVYQDDEYNLAPRLHLSADGHEPLGIDLHGTTDRTAWLDPTLASAEASLRQATGARAGRITGWTADRKGLIYRTIDDRAPGTWFYFDAEANALRKIVEPAPWLHGMPLAGTRTFTIERADASNLTGLMTTPVGYALGQAPVVLLLPEPIGGSPRWGWNPVAQWLASRGCVVMEVWLPGMAGARAARPADPDAAVAAIGDALAWARDKGFSSPGQTVLMGRFFGGWQALQGLARHPEAAAGAIALGPVLAWGPLKDGPMYPGKTAMLADLAHWFGTHFLEPEPASRYDVPTDAFDGKRLLVGRNLGNGDVHPRTTGPWLEALAADGADLTVFSPGEEDRPLDLQRSIEAFLAGFLPIQRPSDDPASAAEPPPTGQGGGPSQSDR